MEHNGDTRKGLDSLEGWPVKGNLLEETALV